MELPVQKVWSSFGGVFVLLLLSIHKKRILLESVCEALKLPLEKIFTLQSVKIIFM